MRLVHGKQCKPDIQKQSQYQIGKALSTHPMIGNAAGTKGTRCVLYSLIVVHEEADDECAHAQLITNRYRLRYRDTFQSTSSETTRTLPKTESWLAA
jgi:hypothetical protein